jgi:hypothetical protein
MADKTTAAIDRMKTWLRENGGRCTPEFVADLTTLIEAAKNKQRQELVRRFAVALAGTDNYGPDKVWEWAAKLVDAEPKIGDAPTEQRRYLCERCGGSGVQPAGRWTGKAYDSLAGRCELCGGKGEL